MRDLASTFPACMAFCISNCPRPPGAARPRVAPRGRRQIGIGQTPKAFVCKKKGGVLDRGRRRPAALWRRRAERPPPARVPDRYIRRRAADLSGPGLVFRPDRARPVVPPKLILSARSSMAAAPSTRRKQHGEASRGSAGSAEPSNEDSEGSAGAGSNLSGSSSGGPQRQPLAGHEHDGLLISESVAEAVSRLADASREVAAAEENTRVVKVLIEKANATAAAMILMTEAMAGWREATKRRDNAQLNLDSLRKAQKALELKSGGQLYGQLYGQLFPTVLPSPSTLCDPKQWGAYQGYGHTPLAAEGLPLLFMGRPHVQPPFRIPAALVSRTFGTFCD